MAKKEQNALDALLGAELNQEHDVFIKRLGTHFTVKSLSGSDVDKLTQQATYTVGKGKNKRQELNQEEFGSLLIAKACKSPDFNNEELKEKYDATDAADCAKKALLAGEVAKVADAILSASGFDDDDEGIEDAKNS